MTGSQTATALTINQAQLFYTANSVSRVYGDNNPAFSGTLTGLKNSDTAGSVTTGTALFTSPTSATTNVGSYAINGSGLTVANSNYVATVLQDPTNAGALNGTYTFSNAETAMPYVRANSTTSSVGGQPIGFNYASFLLSLVDVANAKPPLERVSRSFRL